MLHTDDLVTGDNTFFVATGITDGEQLRGVRYTPQGAETESIVMRSRSDTIRSVRSKHALQKVAERLAPRSGQMAFGVHVGLRAAGGAASSTSRRSTAIVGGASSPWRSSGRHRRPDPPNLPTTSQLGGGTGEVWIYYRGFA